MAVLIVFALGICDVIGDLSWATPIGFSIALLFCIAVAVAPHKISFFFDRAVLAVAKTGKSSNDNTPEEGASE